MLIESDQEANKELFRRFLDEVVNPGAPERMEEFVAPGYIDHTSGRPWT